MDHEASYAWTDEAIKRIWREQIRATLSKPILWIALPLLGALLFGIGFSFAAVLNIRSTGGWPVSAASITGGWVALLVGVSLGLGTLETNGRKFRETMRAVGRINLKISDAGLRWELKDGTESFVPWSALTLSSHSVHALYLSRPTAATLILPGDLPKPIVETILQRLTLK